MARVVGAGHLKLRVAGRRSRFDNAIPRDSDFIRGALERAFATRAVVTLHEHDNGVVQFTRFSHGVDHAADLVVGMCQGPRSAPLRGVEKTHIR